MKKTINFWRALNAVNKKRRVTLLTCRFTEPFQTRGCLGTKVIVRRKRTSIRSVT